MGTVEAGLLLRFDDVLDQPWDRPECLVRRLVGHAEREDDPPLEQPLEIADPAGQQIGIAEDELLARQTPDTCRFEPDTLHRAHQVVHDDEVAGHEGLVQHDRERREQIGEDVLDRERHGDSAHAQTRDQRRDLDAEVAQHDQQHQRP